MKKYLIDSYRNFPLMRIEDFIKQIYQAEYGCEHMLDTNTETRLTEECLSIDTTVVGQLFDTISNNLVRVNLVQYCHMGYSLSTLADMMKSVPSQGSIGGLEDKLAQFLQLVEEHKIDLPVNAVKRALAQYRQSGYGAIHHSTAYRLNYNPHYRVVDKRHAQLLPVIDRIDSMLLHRVNIIVAIDGNSCSGKSLYAEALSQYYNNCNVIHCDHFFLPPEMRSPDRLAEVGGNIHYERLKDVLNNVTKDIAFCYQQYHCHDNSYTDIHVQPKRLTIVEGSYSLHSKLSNYYNIGIVLSVDASEQRLRVSLRETPQSYHNFMHKWIPLENNYMHTLQGRQYIYIDTTGVEY